MPTNANFYFKYSAKGSFADMVHEMGPEGSRIYDKHFDRPFVPADGSRSDSASVLKEYDRAKTIEGVLTIRTYAEAAPLLEEIKYELLRSYLLSDGIPSRLLSEAENQNDHIGYFAGGEIEDLAVSLTSEVDESGDQEQ